MFCTDHTIHHAWTNQIKRILCWMLRIFFAATIGFEVPIQEFNSWTVIGGGMLYFTAIIGKLATGVLSSRPLKMEAFLTVAFSMSAWGEFAFILATTSYSMGNIDKTSFASVLMAVLLSVIVSPFALRQSLIWANKKKQKQLTKMRRKSLIAAKKGKKKKRKKETKGIQKKKGSDSDEDDENREYEQSSTYSDSSGLLQNAYYLLHTRARARWGHQDKLLRVLSELNLEIIDFRAWHSAHSAKQHHKPDVHNVFYVQVSCFVPLFVAVFDVFAVLFVFRIISFVLITFLLACDLFVLFGIETVFAAIFLSFSRVHFHVTTQLFRTKPFVLICFDLFCFGLCFVVRLKLS